MSKNQVTIPKKVLIVVDMQKDFVDPEGSLYLGHDTSTLIDSVANRIKEFDGRVVYTLDTHNEDSCEFNSFPAHCVIGTDGHKLTNKVADAILEREQKTMRGIAAIQKGSFGGEMVERFLTNSYKHAEFEVVGVCTHICVHDVVSGLVNAFKNKYNKIPKVTIPKALVDDFNPEMAEMALARMQSLYSVEVG